MARTRIIATLGPATRSEERIAALIDSGVDVFRLNFSHGTREEHGRTIKRIRRKSESRPIAILQDLGGPKLRLGRPVEGEPGDEVRIALPGTVRPGDPVLLADGTMQLEVIEGDRCRVVTGGSVPAGKGINLPSSRLEMPSLTDKDREDLEFGIKEGIDLVALSFVRTASDLDEVRKCGVPVIAKFETASAVRNMKTIVPAADGVMVARGDLGVEIPIEAVPGVQKDLIDLARRSCRPVITATQMLRSMVDSPAPTRAEATDVANAVLDGTDGVMLSEETAIGRYPEKAVGVMGRILDEAERRLPRFDDDPGNEPPDVVAHNAVDMAAHLDAQAIVVLTRSGYTALKVARYRPSRQIVALVPDESVRRRLSVVWGVTPLVADWEGGTPSLLKRFADPVRSAGLLPEGAPVVVTEASATARSEATNFVLLSTV